MLDEEADETFVRATRGAVDVDQQVFPVIKLGSLEQPLPLLLW